MTATKTVTFARAQLACRAAAEIDALRRMLSREVAMNIDEPPELELIASSTLLRIGELANTVMSAINDELVQDADLAEAVFGKARAAEELASLAEGGAA